jgi:phthalate 4,5-dioxygenase oxygenase subunit
MLSQQENELLTRVEGDAPMGRLFRRYWIPALLSEDVTEADGTPVPVRLLGQDLVAFRDTQGRLGLIEDRCAHRLAALSIGRNENCGLTCIYHGWKFDVDGNCVDMPTEPEDHGFQNRIKIRSYPTRETPGLIWTYLGPPELEPPFPAFRFTAMPANQVGIVKVAFNANFVQAIEGSIDSAHSWFLHSGSSRDWNKRTEISADRSPRLEAEDTPYGFRYAAIRKPLIDPEHKKYVRVTLFAVPNVAFIPPPLNADQPTHTQIFVPVDDGATMLFDVYFSQNDTPVDQDQLRRSLNAVRGVDLDEADFRPGNKRNRWHQDRAAMKRDSWTGIKGFQHQDIVAQESMGPVVDRSQEHLGMSDIAIIRMRRRMLESLRRLEAGEPLIGQDGRVPYERMGSEQRVLDLGEPWQRVGDFRELRPIS